MRNDPRVQFGCKALLLRVTFLCQMIQIYTTKIVNRDGVRFVTTILREYVMSVIF